MSDIPEIDGWTASPVTNHKMFVSTLCPFCMGSFVFLGFDHEPCREKNEEAKCSRLASMGAKLAKRWEDEFMRLVEESGA